ncbi:ATP-binding cassette sub-family D member 3-like [Panonychus citri]|uniref:ATP-binding cassette sub-family D member 3-like n=1 Tax=Panonychus citri TaxID=50023 RepID=UPI002307C97D|nr:ATP-binding cassette sub-family D member 3-like [Panonychus citri]
MSILSKLSIPDRSKLTRNQWVLIVGSSLSLTLWTCSVLSRGKSNRRSKNVDDQPLFLEKDGQLSKRKTDNLSQTMSELKVILNMIAGGKEYAYGAGVILILIVKTINDLWLMSNGTQIEAAIITANLSKLKSNLSAFFLAMPTLAVTNNLFKYFLNQLRLNLRNKLSVILYDKYIDGLTYYRINVFDDQCRNLDQLLTSDVEKFCNTLVDVYSNIAKPLLDIFTLVYRLSVSYTGFKTPGAMITYLLVSGTILTSVRRPLTRLTIKETQLEGQLRYVHSRLIANCEEVAFYQGNSRERLTLMGALGRLKNHLNNVAIFKFNIDFLDNLIARYFAVVVGYLSLAIPFFSNSITGTTQDRLEAYYKSGRMMVRLAESIGRLVLAGRDLSRLAAYTQRVTQLIRSIEANRRSLSSSRRCNGIFSTGSGVVQLCDIAHPQIVFENVPLATPGGDILVKSLSFTIKQGQNVIVTGPNGCGKSSLFRIIGELWPLCGGKLIKPPNNRLFYIPQKPYLALGTLRDQIIYPDTVADMRRKGVTDEDLITLLAKVELTYLLERDYNMDSIHDWAEVFSGGEKQRIAISRLLYNRPLFAILDECTSAVSVDVEQRVYQYLTVETGCTLLSVTHRVKQLQQFHQFALKFDGCGSCSFEEIEEDSVLV